MTTTLKHPPIGIDLGTTYSAVAAFINGRVEVIPNDQGNRTTPSVVAFTDTERLIGDGAKGASTMYPSNTIFDIKRIIGKRFSDPGVQADIKNFPFKVISDANDNPLIEVQFKGEVKRYSPEEISAMVLTKMKETAEAYLGMPIRDVVVTVPAYFNDSQRQSTKDAVSVASMHAIRVLNEPTSANFCYDLTVGDGKEKKILVFDLGGGTFDVSVLESDDGLYSVKAVGGNVRLGGEDFDLRLVEYFAQEFKRKHGKDMTTNPRALRRLKTACERAKRTLSSSTQAALELETLHEGIDFMTQITRAKFEDLCSDLFRSTIDCVEKVLRDARITRNEVDEIVLVGGSTRIPKVQQLLSEYFNGKELNKSVNPDEAVAYGAAVQAAILAGVKDEKLDKMVLVDVTPLSLGIETAGGVMSILVARNSPIPTKKTQLYSTYADNQERVDVVIYEGERIRTADNNRLGNFTLTDIPPMPRGTPKIEISLDIDSNGILHCTAEEKTAGKKSNITIKNDKGRLSQGDIDRLVKEAEAMQEEDNKFKARVEAKNNLEALVYSAKNTATGSDSKLSEDDKKAILSAVEETQKWLDSNSTASKEEFDIQQKAFQDRIHPIIMKSYQTSDTPPQSTRTKPTSGPTVEEVD